MSPPCSTSPLAAAGAVATAAGAPAAARTGAAPTAADGGRPLRIGFVVRQFPLVSETFVLNLAAGVLEAGHELDILSLSGVPSEPHPGHPLLARYGLARHHYPIVVPPHHVRPWRAAPALRRAVAVHGPRALRTLPPLSLRRRAWTLALLHRSAAWPRSAYDIVHCQFATLAWEMFDQLELGLPRGRLIVHLRGHDITCELRRRGAADYRRVFAVADRLIASSAHLRDRAVAAGCPADKIEVVTSGIDLAAFPFRPPRPPSGAGVRLVAVGRLVEKKGFAYVLEAVARLRRRHEVHLDLVGDGPLRPALTGLAARLGLADHVTFHGMVGAVAVARLLAAGDLFVAASVTAADGDQEGLPNALKEAMALGLPVVATRHAGIPELIDHGVHGFLVPEHDAAALAEQLAALIEDPAGWAPMARAARARVASRCANAVVNRRILALYRRVAGDAPAAAAVTAP